VIERRRVPDHRVDNVRACRQIDPELRVVPVMPIPQQGVGDASIEAGQRRRCRVPAQGVGRRVVVRLRHGHAHVVGQRITTIIRRRDLVARVEVQQPRVGERVRLRVRPPARFERVFGQRARFCGTGNDVRAGRRFHRHVHRSDPRRPLQLEGERAVRGRVHLRVGVVHVLVRRRDRAQVGRRHVVYQVLVPVAGTNRQQGVRRRARAPVGVDGQAIGRQRQVDGGTLGRIRPRDRHRPRRGGRPEVHPQDHRGRVRLVTRCRQLAPVLHLDTQPSAGPHVDLESHRRVFRHVRLRADDLGHVRARLAAVVHPELLPVARMHPVARQDRHLIRLLRRHVHLERPLGRQLDEVPVHQQRIGRGVRGRVVLRPHERVDRRVPTVVV